jgi:hypothetical protein
MSMLLLTERALVMESIVRKIAGRRRAKIASDYYNDVLQLLKEWTEQGIPQEEQAGMLNAMGKTNSEGMPYSQVMVSRVVKRGLEEGKIVINL